MIDNFTVSSLVFQVAFEGTQTFLERCFPDSGTDLGVYLMEVQRENGMGLSEERLSKVYILDGLYEKLIQTAIQKGEQEGQNDNDAVLSMYKLKLRFLKAAHKWAVCFSNKFTGDAKINILIGKTLIASGKINNGLNFLASGESPTDVLQQVAVLPKPKPNSRKYKEAHLTYSLLCFLGLGNLRDANAIIAGWQSCCGLDEGEPNGSLYYFCIFLCKTAEYDAAPVYQRLLAAYKDDIKKYPEFKQLIEEVGKTIFGITPPPSMLQNVMSMLQ